MTTTANYSFSLTDAELARYRAMADHACRHEGAAWTAAGIVAGAIVVDLGCGPGTFLPELADRVGPGGRVTGVDQSADAAGHAAALVERLELSERVDVRCRPADDTGVEAGSVDTVFIRNVLVHNGPGFESICAHVRSLLREGGRVLVAEPDLTALVLPDDAPDEDDLEQRWRDWMVQQGNDPGLGRHLASALRSAAFRVIRAEQRVDTLTIERSPALTTTDHLLAAGLARPADVVRWQRAAERRLARTGPLEVTLPTTVVVAAPAR